MHKVVILLFSLFLAAGPASAALVSNGERTHERVLDNRMKVIVREDHRAPVIVSQVWYKIGSSYEYGGITGVSHVLEHMMFQGTPEYPDGEFSRIIAANGGSENAFTSRDYTAYYQQLEASRYPVSFELEADRMRNLLLKQEDFEKEAQVVMEERRLRTDDQPNALTYETFMATAFKAGPYRQPVIGWMDDLQHLSIDDLKRWYAKWYAPNNATLVVVGDVDPEQVFAEAEKHFGPLQPSDISPPKPRREPPQQGVRRIEVEAPAQNPVLLMGYKVPVLKSAGESWKPYALEVLASVLDSGDSARLTRDLVRGQQIAASAGAGYNLYAARDSLLTLSGVPAQGHTVDELEQALLEQIRRLRDQPVEAGELERIKAQVTASNVYQLDSVSYQARQIGSLESVGLGWETAEEYVDRVEAVTPEQVQQVAREYLKADALTIARLNPQPSEPQARDTKGASLDAPHN
ncbi:M16 family metallopeptidase [Thiohalomonas denitrificans]|uniref:Zinc protease n=1 Tax=Thiohalomonas denitrificans TaxID=415747 RepID=A0A1G5PVL0_9GAMM|nr:pitrilysin family protein [Thiohalomonas denitrificans]SCZ53290.1 zinc protease [Thiohalomonas denitrificans]